MKECIICGNRLTKRQKKYCSECRENGLANKYSCRQWYRRHKKQKTKYEKRRYLRLKSEKEAMKQSCVICGVMNEQIYLHELSGNDHYMTPQYYVLHKDTFVPLCYKHHRMIHGLIDFQKLDDKQKQHAMQLVQARL